MPRLLALAALLVAAGCDSRPALPGPPEPLCTEELRVVSVRVVAPGGTPATGLRAQSVVVTTGEVLSLQQSSDDGVYPVASDADAEAFADGSRIVRFTATDDEFLATADFVLSFDGCHIVKENGPTEITARLRSGG